MKIVIADANLAPLRAHLEEGFPSGSEVSWPGRRDLGRPSSAPRLSASSASATSAPAPGSASARSGLAASP